jgi:primosomal protein N' (replication factor Y)
VKDGRILRVAINAPLSRLFDYLPIPGKDALPGCRVRVPFGRRTQTGLVMETATESDVPVEKLKSIAAVLDDKPLFGERDLWLIRFTSDYYHHPVGEVAAAAMPALLRQGKPATSTTRYLSLKPAGADADIDAIGKRAPRQAELLNLVRDADTISFTELDQLMPLWRRAKKG